MNWANVENQLNLVKTDEALLLTCFYNFDFLKLRPIFAVSVDNFGKRYEKNKNKTHFLTVIQVSSKRTCVLNRPHFVKNTTKGEGLNFWADVIYKRPPRTDEGQKRWQAKASKCLLDSDAAVILFYVLLQESMYLYISFIISCNKLCVLEWYPYFLLCCGVSHLRAYKCPVCLILVF